MKPEQAEQFLIEELFRQTQEKGIVADQKIKTVDRLTGDASTRRYYRLYLDNRSLVACLDNPTVNPGERNTFVSNQKFLKTQGVRVPEVLDVNLAKGYILEEDLGDTTFLSFLSQLKSHQEEYSYYRRIIDQLLQIHTIPHDRVIQSELFNLKFDFQKLMDEMEFTFKFFIRQFLLINDEDYIQILRTEISPICQRLGQAWMVLTHRDFHSRNIMVKNNELIFIDFQDARMGIPQYDLVSLLEDCYYDLHEANRTQLKRYYFDQFKEMKKHQGSYENFLQLYNDMLFQRVFKAIGSFSYIYATRKDVRYLKYIGFGMEKLRRMMLEDQRFSHLRGKLFELYYAS